jgi:hypothetical protein
MTITILTVRRVAVLALMLACLVILADGVARVELIDAVDASHMTTSGGPQSP